MAETDRDRIRAQVGELLDKLDEPERFDRGLQRLLLSLGSEEGAAGARRYIPGMGESYGVRLPALRVIAVELHKGVQHSPAAAFALAEQLWHNGSRDERVIVAKLLERLGRREPRRTLDLAAAFVCDITNWEECDQLACFGLRNVVQRHPELVLPRCAAWVREQSKWVRRFGVAVLTSLPKDKAYRPGEREFSVLDAVMADEAREVQDAVAWALREIGKRHPASVVGYLRRHACSDDRATRRIVRAGMKVLPDQEQAAIAALMASSPPQ